MDWATELSMWVTPPKNVPKSPAIFSLVGIHSCFEFQVLQVCASHRCITGTLWLRMDLPHATEIPDSVKWIKCKMSNICVVFSLSPVGNCNHPIHKGTQNKSEYQQENVAGDFGTFFFISTHLAVLLIPRMHDCYKLYLVAKVTNQAFQRYKIKHQLVLLKERNDWLK